MAQWPLWSAERRPEPMVATGRAGSHEMRHHEGGRFHRLERRAVVGTMGAVLGGRFNRLTVRRRAFSHAASS